MRSYGRASETTPNDYKPTTTHTPVGTVKRLEDTVARLEHRSDCLEERIAELEAIIAKMTGK